MKNIALIILCIIGTIGLFTPVSAVAQGRNEPVFTVAEQQPEFPGGNTALSRYLAENIKFPNSLSRKNYNTGPVSAKFIIGKDGVVRDVRVTSKPLDKKTQKGMQDFMTTIISAIEKMPRWQPGEVNGKPVAVFYTLPIEVSMQ
ncbi:energy transducer TonB [Spirosoma sp. RP8]|uniref:Energy transducer TonB n=1 Tax=Spirosoma liriopis TaxID=2937440 RepID=A0ABT0HU40_9BACT|nr:energy transducer TonB [Spirosoma liriopis]MCK8495707.1 energy transducer TonB [Spirosoma liriopis]